MCGRNICKKLLNCKENQDTYQEEVDDPESEQIENSEGTVVVQEPTLEEIKSTLKSFKGYKNKPGTRRTKHPGQNQYFGVHQRRSHCGD